MLTRLGKAGADTFGIVKIGGLSSVTISRWYVNPTPAVESLNAERREQAEMEVLEAAEGSPVLRNVLGPCAAIGKASATYRS